MALDPWQRIEWALRTVPAEKGLPTQVLLALVRYADDKGECYPSQPTLARLIYGDEDAEKVKRIRKATRWLEEQGLVEVQPNGRKVGSTFTNLYRLTFAYPGPIAPRVSETPGSVAPGGASSPETRVRRTRTPGSIAPQTPGPSDPPNLQENIQKNTQALTPTARFRRGLPPKEETTTRSETTTSARAGQAYLYNRYAEPCAICHDWVQVGGGTLLRAEDGNLHAAHHFEECIGHSLTDDERLAYLDGRVPTTITREVDPIDVAMAFADIEEHA